MTGFLSLGDLKTALFELNIAAEIEELIDFYISDAIKSLESVHPLGEDNQLYQLVLYLQKRQT